MKDKTNLWRLYNSSTAYGKRPSDFMQLETEIAAWALDEACLIVGRRYENMLNEGKNPFSNSSKVEGQKSYAPVPKKGMKRMKIPENGIW